MKILIINTTIHILYLKKKMDSKELNKEELSPDVSADLY